MVKVLPQIDRAPSFGTRIARALGSGIGEGIPQGISQALEMRDKQAQEAKRTSEKMRSQAGRYLKEYHSAHIATPEDRTKIIDMAEQFTARGHPWDEALTMAARQIEGQTQGEGNQSKRMGFGKMLGEGLKANLGLGAMRSERPAEREIEESRVPSLLHMSTEERRDHRKRNPIRPSKEDRKRGRALAEPDIDQKADPLGAAKGIGVGALRNLEKFSKDYGMRAAVKRDFPEEAAKRGLGPEASEFLEQKMLEGASDEEQELIKKRIETGQLSPLEPEMLVAGAALSGLGKLGVKVFKTKAFKSFWKSAKKIAGREGSSTIKAAEKMATAAEKGGVDLAKAAAGDIEEAAKLNTLAGRMSTEVPEKVTQTRMGRLSPESRMFKTGEQKKILETQLKSHPKYAAEISAQAEKRAVRLNKPPGEVRKATIERTKEAGQKLLPEAVKSYQSAVGRVRALESEAAKLSQVEQAKLAPLLEASKTELKDAETYYSAIASNARNGKSVKVGSSEMKKSARDKIEKIKDAISEGETVKLAKMDHNPERVKMAKRVDKNKKVPSTPKDDYLTRVHDTYAKEYRDRLAQVRKEATSLPKTGYGSMQKRRLDEEAKVLHKLITHAEADSTIHRHTLGLREMEQRKIAKERLGKTTTKGKTSEISNRAEDIFHKRSRPAETAHLGKNILEGKVSPSLVSEKAAKQAKVQFPSSIERIDKEKTLFQKGLEDIKKDSESLSQGIKSGTKVKNPFGQIQNKMDALLIKVPLLGKSWAGRNILMGVVQGTAEEILEAFGAKGIGAASWGTALMGGRGALRGYPIRISTKQIIRKVTHAAKDFYKVYQVEKAYAMKDKGIGSKRIKEMRDTYSSKIMKEGLGKYQISIKNKAA